VCLSRRHRRPIRGGGGVEYDHTLGNTVLMPATERVTITLPAALLEEVDQLERNRSRFIAEAVRHEVTRRRRAALLESVRSPHPEATQLVDVGLADWTSELPDDEGLLDPAGGTAVRWVEGEGWIKESA
jgi:hypothetical protein